MVDKLLAECAAFVSIFDRFFITNTGETNALDNYAYPLVIEICHDDWERALAFSSHDREANRTFKPLILFA